MNFINIRKHHCQVKITIDKQVATSQRDSRFRWLKSKSSDISLSFRYLLFTRIGQAFFWLSFISLKNHRNNFKSKYFWPFHSLFIRITTSFMKWNRTKCGHWIDRKDASSCSDSNCIGIFQAQKSRMSGWNHSASCDRPKTVSENVFVIQSVCLIWKGLGHFPYYLQSTRLLFGSTSQNINCNMNYIYIHEPLIAPVLFLNQSFTPVSMNFSTVCVSGRCLLASCGYHENYCVRQCVRVQ